MESRIVHAVTGETIRTIKNPIRWLFDNDRIIARMDVKPYMDGGGLLIAYTDDDRILRMTWTNDRAMMDSILHTRAWRFHFSGISVHRVQKTSAGFVLTRYIIGE